jgi:cell surface protein SprA
VDGKEYAEGFGRKQQDVLVPAFIAAYTGKDPTNFEFSDMFNWLPRPNWTLNYNGLSKLKIFQNVFSNVRISHGYKSTLTINSFESDLSYDDFDENTGTYLGQRNPDNLDEISQNYYSRFLVPSIVIDESFAPLLGIEVKTKNDMVFTFNYNKKRNLQMGFISYELAESQSTTIDLGFDWKLKNVRIGFLPGFNSMANKKKSGRPQQQPGAGTPKQGNDLDLSFDLSFSDNITVNHLLDQQIGARPTRGSKDISISPALSYDVNKNVSLRFFVDYRRQEPYVSNSYVVVNTEGGITVRIKLE